MNSGQGFGFQGVCDWVNFFFLDFDYKQKDNFFFQIIIDDDPSQSLGIRNCVEFLRFAQALIDSLIIRTIKILCFDSKANVGQKRLKRSKKKEEAKERK